jgi:hypothetical protein
MEQSQNLSFRSTITGTALKLNLIVQNLNLFEKNLWISRTRRLPVLTISYKCLLLAVAETFYD